MSHVRIAVDPGSMTGIAVWDCDEGRLVELVTVPAEEAVSDMCFLASKHKPTLIIVERPAGSVYPRPGANRLMMLKLAKNVGQCIGLSDEIARAMVAAGYQVKQTSPIRRGTKWSAERFRMEFDWHKRSSNHARDAAVLAKYFESGGIFA